MTRRRLPRSSPIRWWRWASYRDCRIRASRCRANIFRRALQFGRPCPVGRCHAGSARGRHRRGHWRIRLRRQRSWMARPSRSGPRPQHHLAAGPPRQSGRCGRRTKRPWRRPWPWRQPQQHGWDLMGGGARAAILEKAADLYEANSVAAAGAAGARGGQDPGQCHGRPARGGGFPALLCAAQARAEFPSPCCLPGPTGESNETDACMAAASLPASRRGISRWRSSPARLRPHWLPAMPWWPSPPSRRRWSPTKRCRLLHQAGVPPSCCSSCRATARGSARCCWRIRPWQAWPSPAPTKRPPSSTGRLRRAMAPSPR